MKAFVSIIACLSALATPKTATACGGCTDSVLLMTLPWAGFGILFLWAWVLTMLGVRQRQCRNDSGNTKPLVHGATLAIFAILGSAGYAALWYLTMGSFLLPSLVVGFVWALYVTIRLIVDALGTLLGTSPQPRTRLLVHSLFFVAAFVVVVFFQTKAHSLDHYIACLGYGHHRPMYSTVMPAIVARGKDSVAPLIEATNKAMENDDRYTRSNVIVHATYCLAQIGGPEAEEFLAGLVTQHLDPDDFGYYHAYRAIHFAYARCAGPRAVNNLIRVFEQMPPDADIDERWVPLVSLLATGSKEGIVFVLDHMEVLLQGMDHASDGNAQKVVKAALGCLAFEAAPEALKQIPVYRDVTLLGDVSVADPRPNDYNSEFYWTANSEGCLHSEEEIRSAWEDDSDSIRKRWMEQFD